MSEVKPNSVSNETLTYDREKIQEAINMLDRLQVTGVSQSNILCQIFSILSTPTNMPNIQNIKQ